MTCTVRLSGISLLLVGIFVFSALEAAGDLVIFHNGDFRYGKAFVIQPEGDVSLTVNGATKIYKKSQVRQVVMGVDAPPPGTIVSVTDFIHSATAEIVGITGWITHRQKMTNFDGKQLVVDVEDGFDIPMLQLYPASYSFFNRQGSFLRAALVNSSTEALSGIEFRVTFFQKDDKLLASKDFYIQRFPAGSATASARRIFEVDLPDIPYANVQRMRVVRKF